MPTTIGKIRKRLITPNLSEVTFAKRGFAAARSEQAQRQLEYTGTQFLTGFGFAMISCDVREAENLLASVPRPFRGFAYEGASMAFAITDAITPWGRSRVRAFMDGPAAPHIYMAYVGVGWAMARLPRPLWRAFHLPDPLLRWLVLDGYGFHQAYFATADTVGRHEVPRIRLPWPDPSGYARRAIDQGIGRALWFVCGADVARLADVIGGFAEPRRADLWCGTGLAAVYAGGADAADLVTMRARTAGYEREIAQGAAFAAKARLRADLVIPHTVDAVRVLCDRSVAEAAEVTDKALVDLPADGQVPAFEVWRQRIQANLHVAVM